MKKLLLKLSVAALALSSSAVFANDCPDVLKFMKRKLNSQEMVNMCDAYKGQTLLIVNTASYCGFTKQFEGLEELYSTYKDQGFTVLGFPAHNFNQEDEDEGKGVEGRERVHGRGREDPTREKRNDARCFQIVAKTIIA